MHIYKGDQVVVVSGADKGAQGTVLSVDRKKQRIIVQNVNVVKKVSRPNRQAPTQQRGFVEMEAPIHISNVMLLDPRLNKPTRIGIKFLPDGTKVRISKKSGEEIPKPKATRK